MTACSTSNRVPETPWAAGVVVRYITKGGELIGDFDLTVDVDESDAPAKIRAKCRGCRAGESDHDLNKRKVHEWANDHAEKCRALPQPVAHPTAVEHTDVGEALPSAVPTR